MRLIDWIFYHLPIVLIPASAVMIAIVLAVHRLVLRFGHVTVVGHPELEMVNVTESDTGSTTDADTDVTEATPLRLVRDNGDETPRLRGVGR